MVESLTGYITRLAEAHDVYPVKLLALEVLPLTEGKLISEPSAHSLSTHLARNGQACNGMGEVAMGLLQALWRLTRRDDLHSLTMLAWSRVLAWEGLLRRTRAWCSVCYEEQAQSGQQVYDQLLWALHVVTICPKHRQPWQQLARTLIVVVACRCWLRIPGRGGARGAIDGWANPVRLRRP